MELELMQTMDLFDVLAEVGTVPEAQVASIAAQLVEATLLCNRLGIAHRDIKLSNVCFPLTQAGGGIDLVQLVRGHPEAPHAHTLPPLPHHPSHLNPAMSVPAQVLDSARVKLADFGMTGFLGADRRLRGRCGTPGYVAPDILKAGANETYGVNVDTFSIGVVAYTLLCGYEPFYGADNAELLRANREVDYEFHMPEWDAVSAQAKDWIAQALRGRCDERITPMESLQHPWLAPVFAACRAEGGGGGGVGVGAGAGGGGGGSGDGGKGVGETDNCSVG
ncbi:kinase-like domain-containing protein [Ochromonadaceae sp. CCMP2298]|nr:kinase-like domain-containing protein [Ochromonadaceae sp. CCMP2298]